MTVADIISYLEKIAPASLAQPGDAIGLHVGDTSARITRIAVAVDPTRAVIDQAECIGAELLVCHHPLIRAPIESVTASSEKGDLVMRAIQAGLSVYVMHTNYDCAPGGVSDALAERLGVGDTRPLSAAPTEPYYKVVVFVPDEAVEAVRAAMCRAGGFIGAYSDCSFRARGVGTFKPLPGAHPYIGEEGKLEQTDEWRLETMASESALPKVIESMIRAHPYEEVAYDIYPLRNEPPPPAGLGRIGRLKKPESLGDFRKRVERLLKCQGFTRAIGNPRRKVETVALCGGGGATLIPDAAKQGADVYVTGDVGHHALLTAQWHKLAVIDAGHFPTEKPGVEALANALAREYSSRGVEVEYVDR